MNIFLFAISYLPAIVEGPATMIAIISFYLCWKDWKSIVEAANPIFDDEIIINNANGHDDKTKTNGSIVNGENSNNDDDIIL